MSSAARDGGRHDDAYSFFAPKPKSSPTAPTSILMKKNTSFLGRALAVIGCLVVLSGCASMSTTKSEPIANGSKILIMPSRDVVQGGKAHAQGAGSGKNLQVAVNRELSTLSQFKATPFEANAKLNHSASIVKSDALEAGKSAAADYVLILDLGEFRNAAPMTFRSDFVTLQNGSLLRVSDGKETWVLNSPVVLEKSNLGNHLVLIDNLAKLVAESILR